MPESFHRLRYFALRKLLSEIPADYDDAATDSSESLTVNDKVTAIVDALWQHSVHQSSFNAWLPMLFLHYFNRRFDITNEDDWSLASLIMLRAYKS